MLCRAVSLNDFINLIFAFRSAQKAAKKAETINEVSKNLPISPENAKNAWFLSASTERLNLCQSISLIEKILRCNFGATNKILRRKLITILEFREKEPKKGWRWHFCCFVFVIDARKRNKDQKFMFDHLLWSRFSAFFLFAISSYVFEGSPYLIVRSVWRGNIYR